MIEACQVDRSPSKPFHGLGVDIGKVIMGGDSDTPNQMVFGDDYLDTPQVPGAFETLSRIAQDPFWDRILLVSKCTPFIQGRTREWLVKHAFYSTTGISPDAVHFCLDRGEKAEIARQNSLDYFIDDRIDVLQGMPEVRDRILFAPKKRKTVHKGIRVAHDWAEVEEILNSER